MKVAIIGAGFSGMLAAYLLEKKGFDVTVYEKQENIGGHCRTLVSKDLYIEVGTVFGFCEHIKELLIELDVAYTERFTYRNFLDENYHKVEHLSQHQVSTLMEELEVLKGILEAYTPEINGLTYGYIHEDLMVSLETFLHSRGLNTISQVITPHLSSFGFGGIGELQAYYAFNIFTMDTLYAFIRGDKLLFINKGFSEVIRKLSHCISDIRYAIEVKNIASMDTGLVKVETDFGADFYDKVIVTTKLPQNVIKDARYSAMMKKIDTNPYFTCAYEVDKKNVVTTYYKSHLGQKGKIQFFHTFKQKNKTILVAYAYGHVNQSLINQITQDIKKAGIQVKHLITAKQWFIFPHLKKDNMSQTFYKEIVERQSTSNICLIGSLVSKPTVSNLYVSIRRFVDSFGDGG